MIATAERIKPNLKIIDLAQYRNMTFLTADTIDEFIANTDSKDSTKKSYIKGIKKFLEYCKANNITTPTRENLLNYKKYLQDNNEITTAQFYLVALKKFYSYLNEYRQIENIAKNIKLFQFNKEYRKDSFTTDQAKELIASIKTQTISTHYKRGSEKITNTHTLNKNNQEEILRNTAIIYLLLSNGLRTIELERANIEDIGTLANDNILYIQGKGKDTKDDYIILNNATYNAINDYLGKRESKAPSEPLFTTIGNRNHNARLTKRTISYIFKEHIREIGINTKRITCHSCRHFTADYLAQNGADLLTIQNTLRHTNPKTSEIYLNKITKQKTRERGQELMAQLF